MIKFSRKENWDHMVADETVVGSSPKSPHKDTTKKNKNSEEDNITDPHIKLKHR